MVVLWILAMAAIAWLSSLWYKLHDDFGNAGGDGSEDGSFKLERDTYRGEGYLHTSLHASIRLRPPSILVQYPAVLASALLARLWLRLVAPVSPAKLVTEDATTQRSW